MLIAPDGDDYDAASDTVAQQHRHHDEVTPTVDKQLRGMQRRHEEELDAIRAHYRNLNQSVADTSLLERMREQESEMARLQESYVDMLRDREEKYEAAVAQLQVKVREHSSDSSLLRIKNATSTVWLLIIAMVVYSYVQGLSDGSFKVLVVAVASPQLIVLLALRFRAIRVRLYGHSDT